MKIPARLTAQGFFKKSRKKVLTNGGVFGILPKLSAPPESTAEKSSKNLKKVLDKRDRVWYSIKAVCSAGSAVRKKLKRNEKSS